MKTLLVFILSNYGFYVSSQYLGEEISEVCERNVKVVICDESFESLPYSLRRYLKKKKYGIKNEKKDY